MDIDSDKEFQITSTNQSQEPCSEWTRIRREWTRNHKKYSETKHPQDHDQVRNLSIHHYNAVYAKLIASKKLKNPLPLLFVIDVLVYGWKSEGYWDAPTTDYNPKSVNSV